MNDELKKVKTAIEKEDNKSHLDHILAELKKYVDDRRDGIRKEAVDIVATMHKSIGTPLKKIREKVDKLADEAQAITDSFDLDFNAIHDRLDEMDSIVEMGLATLDEIHKDEFNPRLEEFEKKISEAVKKLDKSSSELGEKVKKHIDESTLKNDGLEKKVKLLTEDNAVNYKSGKKIGKQVFDLEKEIKKLSKSIYEFGSSLTVLSNSTLIGNTFGLNFKNGTNTTVVISANQQGFIDIQINATGGGGGFTPLPATEKPNGARTVFTFVSASAQPTFVISDHAPMPATDADGVTVNWTWNAGTKQATMTIPPNNDISAIQ